jgi:hypothetical protein
MALRRLSLSLASACQRAGQSRPLLSNEFIRLNTHRFLSTAAATHSGAPLDGDADGDADRDTAPSSPEGFRDFQEQRWERNYQQVLDKMSTGTPITEPYLKRWISRQRIEYSKRMKGTLTRLHDTRLQKVLMLEDKFQILQTERHMWEKRYNQLVQFTKDHDGMFPYDVDEADLSPEDVELLEWCARQRSKKGIDGLSADRLDSLNAIGFAFSMTAVRWSQRYQELVQVTIIVTVWAPML